MNEPGFHTGCSVTEKLVTRGSFFSLTLDQNKKQIRHCWFGHFETRSRTKKQLEGVRVVSCLDNLNQINIVFEAVCLAQDSGTLEQVKELSSKRVNVESINENNSITDPIAREIFGD